MSSDSWTAWLAAIMTMMVMLSLITGVGIYMDYVTKKQIEKATGIYKRWQWLCKCGHPKSTHKGSSGPNSIGQYNHGECTYRSKSYPPYRSGGCSCYTYKRLFFPRYRQVS